MKIRLILSITAISFIFSVSFAQDVPSKKSYGWAGIQYTSDAAYLGRKDSVSIPYITPQVGFVHQSGLYLLGSVSYLPRSGDNRIDVATITAGYDFSIGSHVYGGFEYDHNFFSDKSYSVLAGVTNSLNGYAGWSLSYIDLGVGADVNFGNETDFLVNMNISHEFEACDGKLHFTPAALVNIGEYNTYADYYTKHRYNPNRGKGKGINNNTVTTVSIQQAHGFHALDYELKAPLEYETDHFKLVCTPTYMIPVNPAQVEINQVIKTETLSPIFVIEIKAGIKLSAIHDTHRHHKL